MVHKVVTADCLDWLREAEENSVDMIATDPPYGLAFMGKSWDKALPNPEVWRECLRVLKPGGAALVMSGVRLDCLWRVCRDLEEAGFELAQTCLSWIYRSGFPKGSDLSKMADKRAGAYPLASDLSGWFTRGKVKPAYELIIWARKPISEGSEFDNVVKHGTGGVNCGRCMIPFGEDGAWEKKIGYKASSYCHVTEDGGDNTRPWVRERVSAGLPVSVGTPNPAGRFPANVLCSDGALGEGSKYFDIDAWWALQTPKASRREKSPGNNHPTVKPVKLFAFLLSMFCPEGGTVLDPFCGSGTTGVAAKQQGFQFIGVEMNPEYAEIARARIGGMKQPCLI